jgi:hypothetical protein
MTLIHNTLYTRVVQPGDPITGQHKGYARPDTAPVVRRNPDISPLIAALDTVLTVNPGAWSANPPANLTYQWYRGATPISLATGTQYTIVSADLFEDITCQETATNSEGSATASSNIVVPVDEILPPVSHMYSYTAPANATVPAYGCIVHGTNTINKLNVHHFDLDGNDMTAGIATITTGDKVSLNDTVYDVIAPTLLDGSGLFSYITIDPTTQKQPGVYSVRAWRES